MALKIYGVSASRAMRVLWMAEELGLDYEHVQIDFSGGSRTPEYLQINPNGHVPAIDDDGLILWESLACNLYLLKKHGGPLQPGNLADEGRTLQWSFWAVTEVEGPLLTILMNKFTPDGGPSAEEAAAATEEIAAPLGVLNAALEGRDYLLGSAFAAVDLNVAAVLSWTQIVRFDLSPYPNVAAWLGRCLSRPAVAAAQAR